MQQFHHDWIDFFAAATCFCVSPALLQCLQHFRLNAAAAASQLRDVTALVKCGAQSETLQS